jgi:hypothetical protein
MPVSNLCCFFGSQITNGIRNILKIAPDIGHLPIVAFLLFTVVSKSYAGRFFGTWHCLLFKLPSSRHTPIEVTPVCVHMVCACSSLSGHSAWQAALHVSHDFSTQTLAMHTLVSKYLSNATTLWSKNNINSNSQIPCIT